LTYLYLKFQNIWYLSST